VLESEEMLDRPQSGGRGGRISLPLSGKGEREASAPFSSGTMCAPCFRCRESFRRTWTLGQAGCWQRARGQLVKERRSIGEYTHSIFSFFLFFSFFFCHSVQQLEVGSQFPDSGLNPGRRSESTSS